MRRSVRNNVLKRVAANRQRAEDAQQRDEREAAAIRSLNKKVSEQTGEDVVAEMCASVIRVQRID